MFLQLANTREVARNQYHHRFDKKISWTTTYTLQGSFYLVTVGCNYELIISYTGNEFRAIFVSTVEALDKGRSKNPTKSLCDRYVFNTLLTRAKSLVVVAGSPYVLLQTEENMEEEKKYYWKMFIKSCIDHETFIIPRSVERNENIRSEFVDNLRKKTCMTSINASSESNAAMPSSIQQDADSSHFQSSSVNVESGKP